MNKYISLAIGIFAVIKLVYGFIENQTVGSIFGFEMNIWIYRAIWALIGFYSIYEFYKKSRVKIKK